MTYRIYLGGSFDPIHHAHLQMAMAVFRRLSLLGLPATISLLPTAGNPFKPPPTPAMHRMNMIEHAITPLIASGIMIDIDDSELARTPPIYTIDTVRLLQKKYPNDVLIFIIGGDSLHTLPTWHSHEQLINAVKLWAFGRVGTTDKIDASLMARCTTDLSQFLAENGRIFLDSSPIAAMSSSQIRTLIAKQNWQQATDLVNDEVLAYILANKLYQTG